MLTQAEGGFLCTEVFFNVMSVVEFKKAVERENYNQVLAEPTFPLHQYARGSD